MKASLLCEWVAHRNAGKREVRVYYDDDDDDDVRDEGMPEGSRNIYSRKRREKWGEREKKERRKRE